MGPFGQEALGNIITKYYGDRQDENKLHIYNEQDIDDIVKSNTRQRHEVGKKISDMTFVARIPPLVVAQLMREGIFFDDKKLLKWLRHNRKMMTHEGRFD